MARTPRVGDLQIGQDLDFERRGWVVQRIGWGILALVLLATLLGLTGNGPFSQASAGSPESPLRVEYERFVREDAPAELRVFLGRGAVREGRVAVWIDREYLGRAEVRDVVPEPESVEVRPDRLTFVFRAPVTGDAPLEARFDLEPRRFGRWTGRVGLPDGEPLRISQFVYP
jgi:hypothetical protein